MDCIWAYLPNPTTRDEEAGKELFHEYLQRGYIHRTLFEMASLPTGAITSLYRQLAINRPVESPVKDSPDSSWMVDADFCFINTRATGTNTRPGNFIQAAKLLPAIRANAIHLGPFIDYDFDNIYAIRGIRTISPSVVDHQLPISGEDQLRALVQAAHLLGKTIGFDLEPHVAQFAVPVIMSPHLFRWFKLSHDRNTLADGMSENEMLAEDNQQQIAQEIHAIVIDALMCEKLNSLESIEEDFLPIRARKRQAYFNLIKTLIERGYWPIPSQSWEGQGVPGFAGYHFDGNYARFSYRGVHGEDLSESAFHILTPYKFYADLPSNRIPESPLLFEPAVNYFCKIFPYWRDRFDFDFVRYDSADHIFDSVTELGGPTSDRATPEVLRDCLRSAEATDKPYIGNFAERMGNEIGEYAAIGFDLILGDDMLQKVDESLVLKSFELYDRIKALNQIRQHPASISFSVDTHDTGNPAFWGEPLVKVAGAAQMQLRLFLARFISAGEGRRPKYEVMGSQDLSYGLYESNISNKNLVWVGDKTFNQHYHYLEDIYERYKPVIKAGEITNRHVETSFAWWIVSDGEHWLVPVIAFNTIEPRKIDLPRLPGQKWTLAQYDFDQLNERNQVVSSPRIYVPAMKAETALLYVVSQGMEDR